MSRTDVVYPRPESGVDPRFDEHIELLYEALSRTEREYGTWSLSPSRRGMSESRYLMALENGNHVNVAWSSTSDKKESTFIPIRIPIAKGLYGYRVCLINGKNQARFSSLGGIEDLRKLTVGQGIGWGDIALYERNGVPVKVAAYESLFSLVCSSGEGAVDLFPRGVNEAFSEYRSYSRTNPGLAVERDILIHYPWPYYFFFNRKDGALAARIEKGLRAMLADGSFDRIFWKYHRSDIIEARMGERRTISMLNPFLPASTPLGDKSLWYKPGDLVPAAR